MKQFQVIEKDNQNWLRTYHPDEVIYGEPRKYTLLAYIGSKPVGSTVDESEVMEVRQMQYEGKWIPAEEDLIDFATLTTRTVYTDAESHDRQISEDYPGIEYQPLFDHMSKVHGLTLTTGEMDEIIGLSAYILAKK